MSFWHAGEQPATNTSKEPSMTKFLKVGVAAVALMTASILSTASFMTDIAYACGWRDRPAERKVVRMTPQPAPKAKAPTKAPWGACQAYGRCP
jgi:hypothetical protein